jgi:ketosteroid isomerase-like protein
MANGAIGPFRGDPDDSEALALEERNKDTVRRYYARVWNGRDLHAIDDLVAENFVIHRDQRVRKGRNALKMQVTETIANFLDLSVQLEEMVALRNEVAVRLNVWHKNVAGQWVRVKGVDLSRVVNGQIVETSVKYQPPELISAEDAARLLPA